jgi:hypothetical protein
MAKGGRTRKWLSESVFTASASCLGLAIHCVRVESHSPHAAMSAGLSSSVSPSSDTSGLRSVRLQLLSLASTRQPLSVSELRNVSHAKAPSRTPHNSRCSNESSQPFRVVTNLKFMGYSGLPKKVVKIGQLYILVRWIIVISQLGHPPHGPRANPEPTAFGPFL